MVNKIDNKIIEYLLTRKDLDWLKQSTDNLIEGISWPKVEMAAGIPFDTFYLIYSKGVEKPKGNWRADLEKVLRPYLETTKREIKELEWV